MRYKKTLAYQDNYDTNLNKEVKGLKFSGEWVEYG